MAGAPRAGSAGHYLPRTERLRKRAGFQAVQTTGRKLHTDHFLVFVLAHPKVKEPGPSSSTRLGVTVSRKVGGSVVRNRVKRLVREAFRRHKTLFPRGVDLVFVAKKHAGDATYEQVSGEIEKLCARYFAR
jgi:ribonuclease P protein component